MNDPLLNAEVTMRGLTYMPLHIERLQKSKAWLVCKRRPELAFYILNLWMRAWTEEPAGSIENDDDVMSDAAMCPPDKWPKLKEDALRGWVLCSDGRWYHPTVCEIALETWSKRSTAERKRSEDRQRKRAIRNASVGKSENSIGHGKIYNQTSVGKSENSIGHDPEKDIFPSENTLKIREDKIREGEKGTLSREKVSELVSYSVGGGRS